MQVIERAEDIQPAGAMAFWSIFVSPLRTLESLEERPRWLLSLVLAALTASAINYYAVRRIGLAFLVRATAQSSGAIDQDAMLQTALEHQTRIHGIQCAASFLGVFATASIIALLLWLLVLLVGGEVTFKKVLAVVGHVTLLSTAVKQSMLALTVTLNPDLATFDISNPLATNLGFFVHSTSAVTARILSSLDLITLINLLLFALGLTKVSHQLSRVTSGAIVLIPWSLYVAFAAWMAGSR